MTESQDEPAARGLDRRAFLALVGAVGLASALPGAAQAAAAADTSASAPPAAPAAPSAEAQALAGVLRRRFPARLTEAQWDAVTRGLDGRLEAARRLAAQRLANGDEPDFAFRA